MQKSFSLHLGCFLFLGLFSFSSAHAAHMALERLGAGKLALMLTGSIKPGDAEKFVALSNVPGVRLVVLHSIGGATMDAIIMGKVIRAKGFATLVEQGKQCFSACTLVWLAGHKRYMSRYALIGAHASYVRGENGMIYPTGAGNAIVGAYLRDLGLRIPAIHYMTMGKPREMYPINEQIAKKLGIDVIVVEDLGESSSRERTEKLEETFSSDAVVIMKTFFSALSMAGDLKYLSHIESMMEDGVKYYSKHKMPRNEVLYRIYKYTKRWPIRYFFVRDNTINYRCLQSGCVITGVVDWTAANPEKRRLSSGQSFYRISVNANGKIFSIQGEVIEARRLKNVKAHRIHRAIWRLEKKHRARLWKVVEMLEATP